MKERKRASTPRAQPQGIESPAFPEYKMVEASSDPALVGKLLRLLRPDLKKSKHGRNDKQKDDPADVFQEEAKRDAEESLNQGGWMSPHAKARVAALVEHEDFKDFIRFDGGMAEEAYTDSDYLLVNGNEPTEEPTLSPMTFVGSSIFTFVPDVEVRKFFILGYFCDMHRPFSIAGSETCKPVGIMLSLLGQLASRMLAMEIPVNLEELKDKDWKKIKTRDLEYLGSIFRKLARQLPSDSLLYCVIDEFTYYDQYGMAEDLETILQELRKTVKACQEKDRAKFKLLVMTRRDVTSPNLKAVFKNHTIDLPEFVEPGDSSQATMEQFSRGEWN